VDAVFIIGLEKIEQLQAVHAAVKVPIFVGSAPASLKRDDLAAAGARILLQATSPWQPMVKAVPTSTRTYSAAAPRLTSKTKSPRRRIWKNSLRARITKKWQQEYLADFSAPDQRGARSGYEN